MTIEHAHALPSGFQLNEYRLTSVLGHGGFGITYLAWDTNLEKEVAIKEYLPVEFAVRDGDVSVKPRSSTDENDYQWGLERFLKEAQTLAVFRHPAIVSVYRFFETHGTAYMVMEYEKGESFAAVMKRKRGKFNEAELRALIGPLLEGLAVVHKSGYLHRDIKPGNIYIREDGSPVLLDFGAARHAIGKKSQTLTSIVTPGYAPMEQYYADGNQGPWTDIYALAGILYQAVTGKIPAEAPARMKNDPLEPLSGTASGKFTEAFIAAVESGLAVDEEHRPQSVADWRAMFDGTMDPSAPMTMPTAALAGPGATVIAGRPGGHDQAGGRAGLAARATGRPPTRAPQAPQVAEKKTSPFLWAGLGVVALAIVGAGTVAAVKPELFSDVIGGATSGGTTEIGGNGGTTGGIGAEEDERRRRAEDERKRTEEAERKRAAEAEAKKREEEAARKRAEEDRRRRAGEDAKRKAREAEARKAREAEARRAAEAAKKRREDAARRAEAQRRQRAAAERRRQQALAKARRSCPDSLTRLQGGYGRGDCVRVRFIFQNTMRTAQRVGVTSRWRNAGTGNSGTLTVLGFFRGPAGQFCRRFRQSVLVQGRTLSGEGTACLRGGLWRIVRHY